MIAGGDGPGRWELDLLPWWLRLFELWLELVVQQVVLVLAWAQCWEFVFVPEAQWLSELGLLALKEARWVVVLDQPELEQR